MSPPSTCVRELLHAKLDAPLAEFDHVADHAAFGETLQERIAKKELKAQNAAQRSDGMVGRVRSGHCAALRSRPSLTLQAFIACS